MKITPEDYADLKESCDLRISRLSDYPTYVAAVMAYSIDGLSPERFRWDLFHSAVGGTHLFHRLYRYLNDAQIDTALRRITGTR